MNVRLRGEAYHVVSGEPDRVPPDATTLDVAKEEYKHLADARRISYVGAARRFENFLLVVSITATAIGFVSRLEEDQALKDFVLSVLVINVVALGFATFRRLVEFRLTGVLYTRGLNRLRHWFLSNAGDLKFYFVLPTDDNEPPFHGVSNIRKAWVLLINRAGLVALINAVVLGSAIALWPALRSGQKIAMLPGVATFLLYWIAQFVYQKRRSRLKEEEYRRDFPELPPIGSGFKESARMRDPKGEGELG